MLVLHIQKTLKQQLSFQHHLREKDPYPNNAFTISFDANINPKLAGIENRSESSKDLFCISEIFLTFFILKALERTGKETVPTAIPAIARLI